jgi:dCMP deaminase
MSKGRISRESMLMKIAYIISLRGTCNRARVGAVFTKDNRIITTGYVGSPSGEPHCLDVGCLIGPNKGCIRTVHAEQAAIEFADRYAIPVNDSTLYVTLAPCLNCAKILIARGIKKVVYGKPYRDTTGLDLLKFSGIECILYKEENFIFSLLLKLL